MNNDDDINFFLSIINKIKIFVYNLYSHRSSVGRATHS